MPNLQDIFTVSALTRKIRQLLDDSLPNIWVEGEVSNFTLHSSGHRYFTLKDRQAQISCVMWRTRRQPSVPIAEGNSIRVYGKVTVWERSGKYQLDVQSVQPIGLGELQAEFEKLKNKLAAEGIFDQSRKISLPQFPRAVGIVTSPTGAAIRDLSWGFSTRYPPADLYLLPVKVQGDGSAREIANAIHSLNESNLVDVIVIGRGGGSLEDLWAFNEEIVIRAIVDSKLPIISAVGHEVDVTLSDLTADVRAPTPTAVASLAVPDKVELIQSINSKKGRIMRSLNNTLSLWRERIMAIKGGYGFRIIADRVNDERLRMMEMAEELEKSLINQLVNKRNRLGAISDRLSALSPRGVLDRGYSLTKRLDGKIVKDSAEIKPGEELKLSFSRGGSAIYVLEVWQDQKGK